MTANFLINFDLETSVSQNMETTVQVSFGPNCKVNYKIIFMVFVFSKIKIFSFEILARKVFLIGFDDFISVNLFWLATNSNFFSAARCLTHPTVLQLLKLSILSQTEEINVAFSS